jgi:hypothetical protein
MNPACVPTDPLHPNKHVYRKNMIHCLFFQLRGLRCRAVRRSTLNMLALVGCVTVGVLALLGVLHQRALQTSFSIIDLETRELSMLEMWKMLNSFYLAGRQVVPGMMCAALRTCCSLCLTRQACPGHCCWAQRMKTRVFQGFRGTCMCACHFMPVQAMLRCQVGMLSGVHDKCVMHV